jgi:predicted aldo/keto reductase-like oxidoreductase
MFQTRADHDVSHCVQCGVCETKCPQGIKIVEQLQLAHDRLKGWVET